MTLATPLPTPSQLLPPRPAATERLVAEQGRVLAGKYVLERPAGFGGMAEVWVATNQSTGAEVCLKLLAPRDEAKGDHDEAVARFRQEAHAAARLSHRAIVRVYDLLELDARGRDVSGVADTSPHAYAIVMELLRGETLGDHLAKREKLPLEEALDLFLPVLSALGHAHRASIIHRDLKPDNIFLVADPDGQVLPKVLDFGISKLESSTSITVDGVLVGTPSFMSPEQARGVRNLDARSDVFSAGILLYMMLDGKNPFDDAPTFASTMDAILRRELAAPAGVPDAIWSVIARATAKDPARRWNDATEMNVALRKAAGRRVTTESQSMLSPHASGRVDAGETGPRAAATADAPVDDATRQRRMIVFAVVVTCIAIGVAAIIATFGSSIADRKPAAEIPPASAPGLAASAGAAPVPSAAAGNAGVATAGSASVGAPVANAASTNASAATAASAAEAGRAARALPRPKAAASAPPPRKPGQEPNIARDPGF